MAMQSLDAGASEANGGASGSFGEGADGGNADVDPFESGGSLHGADSRGSGAGRSAFGDAGGLSYEYSEHDEEIAKWHAMIANHDPGKVGLYEDE
ncbi:MAG: hypothetical protein LBJ46_08175 [Planctomycetota bacterium]|jgi:hypothetical protein|nr:hypothetical protein [Planctomycetota bacterium]